MNYDENSVHIIISSLLTLVITKYKHHFLTLSELENDLNTIMNSILVHTETNCSAQNFTKKIKKNSSAIYTDLLKIIVLLRKQSDMFIEVNQENIIMKWANTWKLIVNTLDNVCQFFRNIKQDLETCIHKTAALLLISEQLKKQFSDDAISEEK